VEDGLLFPGASDLYRAQVLRGVKLKYPNWGLGDFAGTLVAAVVVSAFASVIMVVGRVDPKHGWPLILTLTLPWLPMVLYPFVSSKYKGNGLRADFGLTLSKAKLRLSLLAGAVCLGVTLLVGLVTTRIFGPINSLAGEIGSKEHGLVRVVFALLVLFGAPIVEEIVFRGLLLGSLLKREMASGFAVLVSAGTFALFHFEPKRLLILFAAGLILGELRRRSGSTAVCAVAHMVNNAPGAVALMFGFLN